MPLFPRIRSKANQRIRDHLRFAAIANGADPVRVDAVLDEMEDDRPFLDWLLNGGFEKLLELLMKLLVLFDDAPESGSPQPN